MRSAKLVVLYPQPKNIEAFERAYAKEHAPMVNETTMKGLRKFVATRILGAAGGGAAAFCRMAELHFPSMDALKACATSEEAQQVVAHAFSISSGGAPVILIAEEETTTFGG